MTDDPNRNARRVGIAQLRLPPGVGIAIYIGQLPEIIPFGLSGTPAEKIEDPVLVAITRDQETIAALAVLRDVWTDTTIAELFGPLVNMDDPDYRAGGRTDDAHPPTPRLVT